MATGLGRARLAIPKVNQNPRPPKLGNAKPLAAKMAGGLKKPPGFNKAWNQFSNPNAHPSNALKQAASNIGNTNFSGVTAAGSTPGSTSAASAAPVAPPSNELFKVPTWTPANAGEADPRDATYWANLAKLQFTDTQEYNKTLAEESASRSGYNLALQQAIRGRGIQERELGENAIKGNLGASGWLNRNQAEEATTYAEERGAAARKQEGELQAFEAARKALQQGFGIEAAQQLAEAAGRRAELAAEETETGAPEVAESGGGGSAPGYNLGGKPTPAKGSKKLPTWTPARPRATSNPNAKGGSNNNKKKGKK